MNENKCHLIIIMFTLFTVVSCTLISARDGSTINTSAEMNTGSSNEATIEDDDEDINANTPAN